MRVLVHVDSILIPVSYSRRATKSRYDSAVFIFNNILSESKNYNHNNSKKKNNNKSPNNDNIRQQQQKHLLLTLILEIVFCFNRIVAKRSVFRYFVDTCTWTGRTNDIDTIEYATFRYDTIEVENDLQGKQQQQQTVRIFVYVDLVISC